MNALTLALFACVVVIASAKPSGIWGGHGVLPVIGASGVVSSGGAAGPTGLVNGNGAVGPNGIPNALHGGGLWAAGVGARGWDDGQWRGEGLLESQDWAGRGAAIVAPAAAALIAPGAGVIANGHALGLAGIAGLGRAHW